MSAMPNPSVQSVATGNQVVQTSLLALSHSQQPCCCASPLFNLCPCFFADGCHQPERLIFVHFHLLHKCPHLRCSDAHACTPKLSNVPLGRACPVVSSRPILWPVFWKYDLHWVQVCEGRIWPVPVPQNSMLSDGLYCTIKSRPDMQLP